jgi:hypothetical protein
MILKRLATALKNQDWATVLIEFLIVVAGIFVGLQVNDWALERENRKQETAALERLLLESETIVAALDQQTRMTNRSNRIRRAAVQFIDSEQVIPDDDLVLRVGINTLDRFPPFIPITAAYQELTSAGQMQLIRSADLREKIAIFHANVESHNRLSEIFSGEGEAFWRGYKRHVIWDYNPGSTTSDILLSTYNWETMRGDEDFILESIGKLRNQLVFEESLLVLHNLAIDMCESIGATINRACDPNLAGMASPTPD